MESGPSVASQVLVAIIPIVGIVMGSIVVFFYALWGHKERKLMIEKGTYSPLPMDLDTFSLLVGILLVAIGTTLTIVFIITDSSGYALLGGLIPFALGAGFLVFYSLHARIRSA